MHTVEAVPTASAGDRAFGCTEFVFQIDRRWAPQAVVAFIAQRLESTPVERWCALGIESLCVEP